MQEIFCKKMFLTFSNELIPDTAANSSIQLYGVDAHQRERVRDKQYC
jgi:hypothetical protein